MEVVNSHVDQVHYAAAAAARATNVNSKPEVELVIEERHSNAAAVTPVSVEEEQDEGKPDDEAAPAATSGSQRRRRRPGGGSARRFVGRLHPAAVARACWRWLKHPAHLALAAWAVCVAASGSMLGLLLVGALDGAFPRRAARNRWVEVNNQVLNALFTLMSIYQHPALFHHAVLLLRWRRPADDAKVVRKAYCRKGCGGASGVGVRAHASVVVVLLHVACFAQYALCGLYWGFTRKARPDAAETALVVVGTAAPALAGLYMYFSPLGRKQRPSSEESNADDRSASDDGAGAVEVVVAAAPDGGDRRWAGGLLDVGADPTACWLSCACTFCVFGWNMGRLGLGNARLHAVTFALLCVAPLWVLNVAAINIHDDDVAGAVAGAGVVLCALGLVYGGFWRARLRRRYGLPGDGCCGDYVRWVFCWGCALAQEVRTGNQILLLVEDDVEDGGGGVAERREADVTGVDTDARALQPLPWENGVKLPCQAGDSELATVVITHTHSVRGDESPLLRQQQSSSSPAEEMRPPVPPSMPERNTSASSLT